MIKGSNGTLKGVKTGAGILPFKELEELKFYPLDAQLPPIVRLYLKAKEVLFLLEKLQKSLDTKMDRDLTKSQNQRAREYLQKQKDDSDYYDEFLKAHGLRRLEDGRVVERNVKNL